LTYEETLRAILRQDPNIVVLGEVRDRFSADTAIQASLTGHKVFTTLHTEDSVGGLLRMMNMGIETFNIASTVRAVVAQRLLRRTCVECARPYQPSKDEARRARLMRHDAHHFEFLRGTGCDACDFSGYHGRVGVFEILLLTDAVRDTLVTTPSVSALREAALRDANFVTLREDALAKAVEGHTTLEAVARHTPRTEVRPLEGLLARLGH
jgi:type IV pilus assembly protein PilB